MVTSLLPQPKKQVLKVGMKNYEYTVQLSTSNTLQVQLCQHYSHRVHKQQRKEYVLTSMCRPTNSSLITSRHQKLCGMTRTNFILGSGDTIEGEACYS